MNLAIIGAGVAGLAAARRLRETHPALAVTVYEKSRGLGGRVATRRRDGFTIDHGAQSIKTPTPEAARLLTDELDAAELRRIVPPVWTFDRDGAVAEGDQDQNDEASWAYASGANRLGKLLADRLDVRREVRVGRLGRAAGGGWALADVDGQPVGEADLVLLTPPAPQIAELLANSELDAPTRDALVGALGQASYRRCISLAFAYDRPIERPFYALVNTDRGHPVSWLALEHAKGPERCPPGHSLLIAQMAPQWSVDHWEAPAEELAQPVLEHVHVLLGEELPAPLWADKQRWRYSLPDAGADAEALERAGAEHGLFFAGDFMAGKGRVHLAIESGWRAAEQIGRRCS